MIADPELERRIAELVAASGTLLRVSEEAEKLSVIFPGHSKFEVCELIVKAATAANVGMELEDLEDLGRRKAFRQERVRRRAYEIWEREGRPEGRAGAHWQEAEREVGNE